MSAEKAVRLPRHAREQCEERGAEISEIIAAIRQGTREPAKHGRVLCQANFPFNGTWQGKPYRNKQVAPVIKDEPDEIVVITVYTFYF